MSESAAGSAFHKLRAGLVAEPANEQLRMQLALALMQAGETSTAHAVALPLATSHNDTLWEQACCLLAQLAEQAGRYDEALVRWESLLGVDVDHPSARAHLARLQRLPRSPDRSRPMFVRADTTLLSPEGVVATRYEIVSQLGGGVTGTVFLARDTHLDLHVALKVLHPFLGTSTRGEARQRFFREARLAAALRHPGVVAVYDLDENTRTLSLEYLPLGTLRDRLNTDAAPHGGLAGEEVAATMECLLQTLAHVHAQGLVHGDIKPRNILLRAPADPVLGDFGVARLLSSDGGFVSEGAAGTPLYFAPEQLRGASSSVSTDLFAVGAVAWELAVGRPLRSRNDLTSGRFDAAPLPQDIVAALGPAGQRIASFVAGCAASEPHARPANAGAALALLRG